MAAELGFEPRQTESESVVLPLHNSALFSQETRDVDNDIYYNDFSENVKGFLGKKFQNFFIFELQFIERYGNIMTVAQDRQVHMGV